MEVETAALGENPILADEATASTDKATETYTEGAPTYKACIRARMFAMLPWTSAMTCSLSTVTATELATS